MTLFDHYYNYSEYDALVPPAAVETYPEIVAGTTPVAYYPMAEVNGSLIDYIGTNDMTVTGSPTYRATGPTILAAPEYAVTFSGTGMYANGANPSIATGAISVLAWVRFGTVTGNKGIVSRFTSAAASWWLFVDVDGDIRWVTYVADASTTIGDASTIAGAYDDSAWHGFIATKNSTEMRVYEHSNPVTSVAQDTTLVGTWNEGGSLRIATQSGSNVPWQGDLAHIAVWDRVLSEAERTLLLTGAS